MRNFLSLAARKFQKIENLEIENLYCLKNIHTDKLTINQNQQMLSLNRYQLLEPASENIELVSENIQNTDT